MQNGAVFVLVESWKSLMKYITRMGQKTGMLKNSKKVQKNAMTVALVAEYQNLNSGRRRMNGRNGQA